MWVPTDDFAQLQLQLVDQTQWRYDVIRPMVLFADRTPRQRADETNTHPATVRTLTRRFRQQGMLGLLPADVAVIVRARAPRGPETVREELDRLKALYDGFRYRELARILFITCGVSIDRKTVKARKSAVERPWERKFLGFTVTRNGTRLKVADSAIERLRVRVRESTRRTRGHWMAVIVAELNDTLLGWKAHFGIAEVLSPLRRASALVVRGAAPSGGVRVVSPNRALHGTASRRACTRRCAARERSR
jgi:hypothetical protein